MRWLCFLELFYFILFLLPFLSWVELKMLIPLFLSSRIVNGKKSMKETLKQRKTCYVQLVPLNPANPHMTNLKQWLEISRSFFLFYLYGYTIKPYLICFNHWFNRTKIMRMVMMTYMLPIPLMRWLLVLYICFLFSAFSSSKSWSVWPSLFLSATKAD